MYYSVSKGIRKDGTDYENKFNRYEIAQTALFAAFATYLYVSAD